MKANKSTVMQPCTLGNQHSHYSTTTCRPVHDTISNSFHIHCVVNKLLSVSVKPQLIQGQIRTSAMENTHACSGAPWPTSFSFCTSCEKKMERGATLSRRREVSALSGVDRALCGDYMRQNKTQDFLLYSRKRFTCLDTREKESGLNFILKRCWAELALMWDIWNETE